MKKIPEGTEKILRRQRVYKDITVNDCIRLYPETIGVFNRFQIDACCGGAVTIEEAARRDKANLDELLKALNGVAEG